MMFTRNNLAVLAVAVVALAAPTARADILLPNVDFILNLRNFDMGSTYSMEQPPVKTDGPIGGEDGEDGWGIFKVTAITDTSANVLWADGQDGMELTGVFYGLVDTGASWDGSEWKITGKGLQVDFWHNPKGSFNPAPGSLGRIGVSGYQGITNVGGTKILSAETRAPGVFGLPEFQSTVNVAGFGDSRAWADVITTVGTQPANFSTGSQLGGTDLYLSSDVFFPGTVADWQFESSDLVKGRFVPEPFSLGLLGIGAVALLRRRRRA
ncbi:MAG TPA: PEP-CTERM sorting domain-containing protein [Phycisphaerae bacterium]|nr:PEP-CTERM sorting domain-containing protein [Phycisphaerae bacterium]